MNTDVMIAWAFIFTSLINILHFAFYLIGANIYDIQRYRTINKRSRWYHKAPLVSVVIPTYNGSMVIERCLDSIRRNTYRNIEVIVHNDVSSDNLASVVRAYQKAYPLFNLRLIDRRTRTGKAGGANFAIKKYAKGEFVMTLDDDSILEKNAIKNAVAYFRNPKVVGVAANVRMMEEYTALGLLQRYEHIINYRSKKFYSITNCEMIIGGVASTYRRSIMKEVGYYDTDTITEDIGLSMKIVALGNKDHRLVYGVDVLASTEPVETFNILLRQRYRWKMGMLQNIRGQLSLLFNIDRKYTKSLTWYRMPFAFIGEVLLLIEPVVVLYLLVRSIQVLNPMVFVGAYLTIMAYIMLVIWPDEHLTRAGKLRASAYAPSMYFVFYIMNVVQIISLVRCFIHFDKVLAPKPGTSHWTTFTRTAKQNVVVT